MGYYTKFDLSYEMPEDTIYDKELDRFKRECEEKQIEVPSNLSINPRMLSEALYEYLDDDNASSYGSLTKFIDGCNESYKWYEYKEDLIRVSIEFPTVLFTLKGAGEEEGDYWVHYFKGGKSHREEAKQTITYPPFNEKKLK